MDTNNMFDRSIQRLCISGKKRLGICLTVFLAFFFMFLAMSIAQDTLPEKPELIIRNSFRIPMVPVTGTPMLFILNTYAVEPTSSQNTLPLNLSFSIEQGGRVLATASPKTVHVPNRGMGEIRHQIKSGPPGDYQVRLGVERNGLKDESLVFVHIAANQSEADTFLAKYEAACAGVEGGAISLDVKTGEPKCSCLPGSKINPAENRCEVMP